MCYFLVLSQDSMEAAGSTAACWLQYFVALGIESDCHPQHEPQCLSYRNTGVAQL